jgi:uncharacterized repeat protein (TIGR01451 family)/fimbrial isopeptide formation D2 family protein
MLQRPILWAYRATSGLIFHQSRRAPHRRTTGDTPFACRLPAFSFNRFGSPRKAWKGGAFLLALAARAAPLGFPLLIFFLSLGAPSDAQATQINCSDPPYNGVIDGDLYPDYPDNVKLDINCTIKNYPDGMDTNFSFDNNDPTPYLIIFDNVLHLGQMSCNTVAGHTIWFVNGSSSAIQEGCQNLLIPVEKIDKQSPGAFATIGVPFTYTLKIPVLYDAGTGTVVDTTGSVNELHSVILTDDLNAMGADISYVSHDVHWRGTTTVPTYTFSNVGGVLTFDFTNLPTIPPGDQIVIEITVVLDDTAGNTAGTVFTNTAKWSFGRLIDDVFYEPLPGENGISDPMTIVEPDLVLTKTSSETALNLGVFSTFTVDVQNVGGSDAWNTTVLDKLPSEMCDYDPTTTPPGVTAQIFMADGITPVSGPLTEGVDYSVAYNSGTCELSLTLTSSTAVIGPSEHLIITYQSQLDSNVTQDGLDVTNYAGATQWFSAESIYPGRRQYDRTITDGTPNIVDFQDSATVTTALSGYYFQKTVENLDTGESPATTAAPGDTLRYRLRLFNVDETIDNITITDVLDPVSFDLSTFNMLPLPAGTTYSFNSVTGLLQITGNPPPLNVSVGGELVVEFEITLESNLTNGSTVDNQAALSAIGIDALSDDPYVNGIAAPGDPADPTSVLIQFPGPLSKTNSQATATIGEQFTYQIKVPATPVSVPLYDVRILDDLGLSNAELTFVSATVVSGGTWALTNTGIGTSLIIEDPATGIDIPADGQAVIDITVQLQNTLTNQDGLTFANSASYTYNRMNGNNSTQKPGGLGGTANMTVVEPDLTAVKSVRFISPAGKQPTDPATVGDILEYSITIPNGGSSTAFDTSVVDTLPTNILFISNSAAAEINSVPVAGFIATPTTLPGGALAWGQQNGDFSLDIPVGQTLVLTYQVEVAAVIGLNINNSVFVDWTSLDGGSAAERNGAGCPAILLPNDYCYGPATVSVATQDNTSIAKSAVSDSYAETPPSTTDPILRVGDTVTYDLTLSLQEFTTENVVVEDDLPAGMALESFTIAGGPTFSYSLGSQPSAGATGTLRWEFGNITNLPSNDGTPVDTLVIQVVVRVVTDAPPVGVGYATSILLDNLARLFYTGGDPAVDPGRLTSTETIDVRQPQMSAISKADQGSGRVGSGTVADPYQVNIATDVMNFHISSCNNGLAPAYGVIITDQLATEFDETDLLANPPVVMVGTTTLTAGVDYNYTAPPRGGELRIELLDSAPVNPGECVTVDYDIGFHTDLTFSTTWSNQAALPEYRSLPLSQTGRLYTPTGVSEVWMTNLVSAEQLLKTLLSPAEATIGQNVVYQIKVPASPLNTALDNIVVTDTLNGALEYVSASAVDGGGSSVVLTDNSVAPGDVSLGLPDLAAGEQVIITLTARVANNTQANAGASITNTASYTASNLPAGVMTASTSAPFRIVEPLLAIDKAVENVTNPGAAPKVGDILRFSVNFTASGGAAGDNFSNAFDLLVVDNLSLGLAYQSGTAGVNGAGNTLTDPTVTGDGSTTAQTLTWSPADGTADIDVLEGTQVTLTYDAVVLNGVLPGQELANSATVQWTGLDGTNALERNGTGTPVENDYFAGPATATIMTELAVPFVKSVVNVTSGGSGANAEPGDTLRYTLVLTNDSIVPLTNASVVDVLDSHFAPGSLQLISVSDPDADTTNTNATGGANGTGVVDIRNLTLAAQGNPGDSVTIEFEVTLLPVIQSGTTVLNQAQLTGDNLSNESSNQTSTLIRSAPAFDVWKTSEDITGDPAELVAGDSLRYTITIKNVGNENAVNTVLQDQIPALTTYVAGSTRLNGVPVPDPASGISALQSGMLIHAPENATPGAMRADATATTDNMATVTFEVVIDSDVVDGTIISNQGFVNAAGTGSGPAPEEPSDDPATPALDDPTRDVVGNVPLVDAQKTVQILVDNGSAGIVDPGDTLRYTITITNTGAAPATGVVFTDAVPVNTTYVADSVQLNGLPVGQPDGGISPLVSGIDVSSSDLTPPLPSAGNGTLSLDSSAVVVFDVLVKQGVATGTVISNQGTVSSNEQPDEPTDADGNDTNGDQPTEVVVGDAQVLNILKEVFVVDGGPAIPGSQLEYVIRVTNIGTLPATNMVVTDDLSPLAGLATYVAGSATLNGSPAGVAFDGSVLSADYAAQYGDLPSGSEAVLRFRVQINPATANGTRLTNTGVVTWNDPPQNASASVSIDVGGTPGFVTLSGTVWHDANLNKLDENTELHLEGWSVELYRDDQSLATVLTDADGAYRFAGLAPNEETQDFYELRYLAPGAGPNTASMGEGDSPFSNGPQRIGEIIAASGSNLNHLNLPLWPNGTIYDSIVRNSVAGARVTMLNATTGEALPGQCFKDPIQADQITSADGFYKFDLKFGDASCPEGGTYFIQVTPPANGYVNMTSQVSAPPQDNTSSTPFPVPDCPGNSLYDALPATDEFCEATSYTSPPPSSMSPADIRYFLYLRLSDGAVPGQGKVALAVGNGVVPGQSQIFNNSIPIDPILNGAVSITKTSSVINVSRGDLVPYTITATNDYGAPLFNLGIVDRLPAGFKYKAGSARLDGTPVEPQINGRELVWDGLNFQFDQKYTIQFLLVVGSGVTEGKYVNRAQVINTAAGTAVSEEATATVRVVPDPDIDCTDVIGKVFDDLNLNGRQDPGEKGLFGVRVVTARGLTATTDPYGRFHITCVVVPDEDRGSNFILKLDERALPSGFRLTTENPRVQRATRGKMIRFNFGATIHHVVQIDVADGAFEPNTSEIRMQWKPKIGQLIEELKKGPSVMRLSYLADVESRSLVRERVGALKKIITEQWNEAGGGYPLTFETEIFRRRGDPLANGAESWLGKSEVPSEVTEMNLPADRPFTPWIHDPAAVENDEGDRTEIREVVEPDVKTIKLENPVPPIQFALGEAKIPEYYTKLLRNVLDGMRDRANVRLHFVGHTDSLPLGAELTKIYGDNLGLSRERAGTVAEYFQRALNLPPEAISYEGMGDTRPVAGNSTKEGRQLNRRVEVQVWYDEIGKKKVEKEVIIPTDMSRVKVCRTETFCRLRYQDGHSHRARIKNLIAPLHYDKGMLSVQEEFLRQVREAVKNLGSKQNLVVKFIGYTDNLPLEGRDKRIYGDATGLSKAVARRVSLAVQEDLGLPNSAVEIDGMGASQPVTTNETEQGRALNRRVEVEFWHDDPLEDLPEDPQMCPGAAAAETVTRVYDSPSGGIDPILFENGEPVIPDGATDKLRRIMDEISDKSHVRLRFVGYTRDRRLDRRTALVYGDDIGLSMARARRAMAAVSERMGLVDGQAEFDGRGYVQSNDVINAGFIESDTSRVEVQVVYDEQILRDDYEGVEITPVATEVHPANPFAMNPMRITVDGKPIDDPDKSSSDLQRCTDVALENARIEFKYDSLKLEPKLNVTAWPETIQFQDSADTGFAENQVNFRLYTNYRSFIERAEVRIFKEEQSVRDTPLAVVEMNADGMAHWQPDFESFSAPVPKLKYLVRVYDKKGLFDETRAQTLWVVDHIDPSVAKADPGEKLLAGYGETRIAVHNIPLSGGTVQAYGSAIPKGHAVWMAGFKVPVDDTGSFVAEEILPAGLHTVEVGVVDPSGNGKLYLRDLALKKSDWFTVGIADVTLSGNRTSGPADLLAPDQNRYRDDISLEGRLAFYTNGKFQNGWSVTASADTREGPFDEIFSNFMDKSPEALFRRIDPEYHYPTFGDDSTVQEDAPTLGKFYVKLQREKTYALWGNFKVGYTENELAHVDRGLYGANLHVEPLATTSFGEPRLLLDGFAADPGTVAGRDEFRGTDGSLYFLRRQDILEGSERVRIEVRDKDSGIVLGVKNLVPVLDYDIDYLQGRILLTQPLPATAEDGMLVSTDSISGNPVFLVIRYEYTPGFEDPNTLDVGGRAHYWLNDHIKVGITASQEKDTDVKYSVGGADLTLRQSSESWVRLEAGRTKGQGLLNTTSNDGGFAFATTDPFNTNEDKALGYRADASLGFRDLFENGRGRVTFYLQDLEAGYSAPGLAVTNDLTQYGGTAELPITDRFDARLKVDKKDQTEGLETEAGELNVDYRIGENWTVSSGARRDSRTDHSPIVPPTQEEGDRTDGVARLLYDSKGRWSSYVFGQSTIQKSGNREENNRGGAGGSLRLTDRFNVTGEVSGGNLGAGGKLGTEFLYSDRTTLYSNYTLENDRTDNGLRARKGNMASGFRTRYSDSASVYAEERYTHGDVPTGLMHSTGVDLTPADHLNLGANLDFGNLKDHQTGADLKRTAAGVNVGYGFENLKLASALEYRVDSTEQPDTSHSRRTTWLLKNSFKYQLSPDGRLIGKFNYAVSDSSMGNYFNGEYTEAVLAYAYRPVLFDRFNALFKYTYFYNIPSVDQVTVTNTPVEFIQRSHIGSVDVMYDLTLRWTVGGKFAYRYGQVAQDRNNPEFFVSRARLYVVRVDWHFVHRWDALVEGRRLDLPDAKDSRSGALVGIYRHLGEYFKMGVGYNFSDFSDDLTQLDYRHQGVFINLIGKY